MVRLDIGDNEARRLSFVMSISESVGCRRRVGQVLVFGLGLYFEGNGSSE